MALRGVRGAWWALLWCAAAAALLSGAHARPAAATGAGTQDATETKSDVPVEQLEQLKAGTEPSQAPQGPRPEAPARAPEPAAPPAAPSVAPEETTTKVFHGAARLVQAGAGAPPPAAAPPQPAPPAQAAPPAHSAVRRSFNADIHKETQHNRDHFSAYGGVQYSPLDMAEYVLWTGDERAVTATVETLLQEGLMTKEEAIMFLQEIKLYLEYLRAQHAGAPPDQPQPDKPAEAAEWSALALGEAAAAAAAARRWELNNALSPFPAPLPLPSRPRRRRYDTLLQTNLLGGGAEFWREPAMGVAGPAGGGNGGSGGQEAARGEVRALEEVVYHLAKMLFAQSAAREGGTGGATASAHRLLGELELQAQRTQLARGLRQRLLDIIIAALTETIGEHPELLQNRDSYDIPAYRLMRDFLETSAEGAPGPAGHAFGN